MLRSSEFNTENAEKSRRGHRELTRRSDADQVVPGGRVELPTPAFSGPRSTGELPRHRGSKRFYGRNAGVSIEEWNSENSKINRTERATKAKSKCRCKRFKIPREHNYNLLDMLMIEMLIPCTLCGRFPAQLSHHFSLHDENSLASTLWSGIGRFVVTRLGTNPNSEEALT